MGGVLLLALGAGLAAAPAGASPGIGRCPVFPKESPWNQRVDKLPVLDRSDRMIRRLGRSTPLHPDFGSGRWQGQKIGIPFITVSGSQPGVTVRFSDSDYSDHEPYPLPANTPIEDRPDRHAIVVNLGTCRLYELYQARPLDGGRRWAATAGATWNLRSTALRPNGWTSADAAGLPMFPGLVRYDEVREGAIKHAMRIAVPKIRRAWVYPARHASGDYTDSDLPAFGQRMRLRKGIEADDFPKQARVVVRALQRYGALVADFGPWHLSGAPHSGWDNYLVHSIKRKLRARDFEFVDTNSLPEPGR